MSQLRFLVIQLRQIGDVLISTAVCETLKQNYPDAQIDYVVYQHTAAIVENNPFIDHLIILNNNTNIRTIYRNIKTICFMRRQHYDYAIDILNTPKSVWLARLSAAQRLIGPKNDKKRSQSYDIQVAYDDQFLIDDPACISIKNRLCLLSAIDKHLKFFTQYQLYLTAREEQQAKHLLQQHRLDFNRPIFFFAPASRRPEKKQWPTENFIEIIDACVTQYNAQIILYPGPGQKEQSFFIKKNVKQADHVFIFTHCDLREMAAIIKLSDLFIGNDGGVAHLAIAVDTPSITIFSPAIWHHDWHVRKSQRHIMITAQAILNIDDKEYEQLLLEQTPAKTKELYTLIQPTIVKQAITRLLTHLYA